MEVFHRYSWKPISQPAQDLVGDGPRGGCQLRRTDRSTVTGADDDGYISGADFIDMADVDDSLIHTDAADNGSTLPGDEY